MFFHIVASAHHHSRGLAGDLRGLLGPRPRHWMSKRATANMPGDLKKYLKSLDFCFLKILKFWNFQDFEILRILKIFNFRIFRFLRFVNSDPLVFRRLAWPPGAASAAPDGQTHAHKRPQHCPGPPDRSGRPGGRSRRPPVAYSSKRPKSPKKTFFRSKFVSGLYPASDIHSSIPTTHLSLGARF